MKSRAYRGTDVNRVDASRLGRGHEGQALVVGVDVGKFQLAVVGRWADGLFERPWRVANPGQVRDLVELLRALACERTVTVALEPSGTYGDALRQALQDAGLAMRRVNRSRATGPGRLTSWGSPTTGGSPGGTTRWSRNGRQPAGSAGSRKR
jgi:transposase